MIDNVPEVSGRRCEFLRLLRTLEPPPKVLYSVVHVVLRALELPREARGLTRGRLWSLKFGLVGKFSKIHGRPKRRKSQSFANGAQYVNTNLGLRGQEKGSLHFEHL